MNNFEKSEIKGRKLLEGMLKSIGAETMWETTAEFDPVDYYFVHNKRKFAVEIKVREAKWSRADTHFLEVKKELNMLATIGKEGVTDAIYVNFFGEDLCVVYNIKKAQLYNRSKVWCNKTTAVKSGKIPKDVIECPASDGVWMKRNKTTNEWYFLERK